MDALGWVINIGASLCWVINIKHRKWAMIGFTCMTLLSIWYFAATKQTPFLLRAIFYLCIDIATLRNIKVNESGARC